MSDNINWKSELRKIEREYDGLPPEISPEEARVQHSALRRAHEQAQQRAAAIAAAVRIALVVSLPAGLHWWPYASDCGLPLVGFVAAEVMVAVGGLWVATFAWRHRLAASHMLALMLFLTGLVLVAGQVLPRQGYVTIKGLDAAGWSCPASAAR